MQVDVSRGQGNRLLYLMGERFIPERRLLGALLRPGMTVVDVGANIGYYLLLFERLVGARGHIICVEPAPDNLVELRKNVAANRFTNAVVHGVAVGARPGDGRLRAGINGFITQDVNGASPVRIEPLDTLVDSRVDVIKIDVEGYEFQVLAGSLEVLRRDRPTLFVELHPGLMERFGVQLSQILETLRPLYSRFEAWEVQDPSGENLFTRMHARYLGVGRVLLPRDIEELVTECRTWKWDRTFWLICRP